MRAAIKSSEVPTVIVFDVERGKDASESFLGKIRSVSKALATCAHVIIVLSEANAVVEFDRDPARERFIFVDEMSDEEATELLRKVKFNGSDEEMNEIFRTIGKNPSMLLDLVQCVPSKMTVKEFVAEKLSLAKDDFDDFPLKPIIDALKQNPEGVTKQTFKNIECKGIPLSDPRAVGTFMKTSNAIIYREDLEMYTLMSTAHKTAIRTYESNAEISPHKDL